jgi:hypothetical protein
MHAILRSRTARPILTLAFHLALGLSTLAITLAPANPASAQPPTGGDQPTSPPPPPPPPPASPLQITNPIGSLRFGFLAQPQYEAAGGAAADGFSHNIYVRRARLLVGGTLWSDFELFFETDFADLMKSDAMGVKGGPGNFIQDVIVTWKRFDFLKIDAGFMLVPLSHNAIQSAASLYGWDYYAFTFRHTNAFRTAVAPVGRDSGVQLRGLLLGGHLEYRVGAFQGLRDPAVVVPPGMMGEPELQSRNGFRVAGRVQVNVFDAEPGFFYAGSYLGTKKILSIGGAFDAQDDYFYWAADGFLDLPIGPDGITAQVNVAQWDGGDFIALPKQTGIMAEAGYRIGALRLSPIFRFEQLSFDDSTANPKLTRIGGGLAWWVHNHNTNLKLFYTQVAIDSDAVANDSWGQINLQLQYFVY